MQLGFGLYRIANRTGRRTHDRTPPRQPPARRQRLSRPRGRRPDARRRADPAQRQGPARGGGARGCADRPHRAHARPRRPHRLARRPRRRPGRRGGLDLRARRPAAGGRQDARRRRAPGQAARRLSRRPDPPHPDTLTRRPGRIAGGRRGARAHARPRRVPRHARPHALLRRRLLDARRHGDDREAQPALPAAGPGDVAPADRAAERARPARAGSRPPRARPRQGRAGTGSGDGCGDREGRRVVPRQGLDAGRVAQAAAELADRDGLEAVTLARVAADLGVRSPSLYHHVAGHEALVRLVGLRALGELRDALRDAAVGRAGGDALAATARAYRAYALAHPGRYAATVAAPAAGEAQRAAAAAEVVAVLTAVLRGFGLQDDEAVHAVRALRSAVHGFVALETAGAFALAVDLDGSFE